jgi:hypothetical protein
MMERVIRIEPDGSLTAIYSDDGLVSTLGNKTCERASDVVFDESVQAWGIQWRVPGIGDPTAGRRFDRRADAIAAEVTALEEFLSR